MESLSLLLLPLLLTTITLAARLYRAQAPSHEKAAEEEQLRKSCQAQATEQAESDRAQIRALQANYNSEKRANGSLRREMSTLEKAHETLVIKSARHRSESDRHRSEINDLRKKLSAATFSARTVENASLVKEQWNSVSGTLAKAGFVAKDPQDLSRSIEKLLELQYSAVALSKQAALDKQELAGEKAAKEAAQEEVTGLKRDVRILEIDIADLKATAEAKSALNNHNHERSDDKAAKLKKQLKKARQATKKADDKLREAEDTIHQKDCEITALNEQKYAEIAALRAELEKVPKTDGAIASTSLQQELSQTKVELAAANDKIADLNAQGQSLWDQHQKCQADTRTLDAEHLAKFGDLVRIAREHEEYANGAKIYIRDMLASFKRKSRTQLSAHQLNLKWQKGKTLQLKKRVAERDQQLTKSSSDLAEAQEEIVKRGEQVTKLSDEIVDLNDQLIKSWDLSYPQFVDSNCKTGTNDNVSNIANGLCLEPQSSSADPMPSGNDMISHGTQAGTDLTFDEDLLNGVTYNGTDLTFDEDLINGLINNGTDPTFSNDLLDGSTNNGGFANSMDLGDSNTYGGSNNDGGSGCIPNSSASNDLSGMKNNGSLSDPSKDLDFSEFVNWGDSNADGGSNNDGTNSQDPTLSAPNESSGLNNNGGFPLQQNGHPDASSTLNGLSGPNTNGVSQPQQNGIPAPPSALNGLSGSINDGAFPPQQNGNPAPSSSSTFGAHQHGGFQSQQNGTSAPSNLFTFETQQNITPAASNSFRLGAQQNGIPAPSGSFTFGAQSLSTTAPSNPFSLGAQPLSTTVPLSFSAQFLSSQPSADPTTTPSSGSIATQPAQPPALQTTGSSSTPQSGSGKKRPSSP